MRGPALQLAACCVLLAGFTSRVVVNGELSDSDLAKFKVLGKEVVRGKDWLQEKHGDQDGGAGHRGIVIRALNDKGTVRVQWESGRSNTYNMGNNGKYELDLASNYVPITSFEGIVTGPELSGPEIYSRMKIGSQVVRGEDWIWNDQDRPDKMGIITEIDAENRHVVVLWNRGGMYAYRMGFHGKYDLKFPPKS